MEGTTLMQESSGDGTSTVSAVIVSSGDEQSNTTPLLSVILSEAAGALISAVHHQSSDFDDYTNGIIATNDEHHAVSGNDGHATGPNATKNCGGSMHCLQGLIIPLWKPETQEERIAWAMVCILFMIYIFVGQSMVSDIFVSAIEVIISQKRRVKVVSPTTGAVVFAQVPIWNETVANFSLLVLGSCAPEILLTLSEVISSNFKAGELGPGTIVGAGAYNLFIIQAICIGSVTHGKTKRVHDLRIYFLTAFWAVFAYVWLYLILTTISHGVVEVWEALLTLAFYPVLVFSAYAVDKHFFGLFSKKRKQVSPSSATTSGSSSPAPLQMSSTSSSVNSTTDSAVHAIEHSKEALEKLEHRYIELIEEYRHKMPNKTAAELQQVAAVHLLKELPKGRGYYRMQTSSLFSGTGDIINVKRLQEMLVMNEDERLRKLNIDPNTQVIAFDPDVYEVMEDAGVFYVHVTRRGVNLDGIVTVDYVTRDGSGKAGVDYDTAKGCLVFNKGETLKELPIHVIDDDEFNGDNEFYVDLSSPKLITPSTQKGTSSYARPKVVLGPKTTATVKKLDDDQGGVFSFEHAEMKVEENAGELVISIIRGAGIKGRVEVPVKITPITALPYVHYEEPPNLTSVIFERRQTEKKLVIKIMNEGKLKKERSFKIEIGEPQWHVSQRDPSNLPHHSKLHKLSSKLHLSARHQSAFSGKKYEVAHDGEIEHDIEAELSKLGRPRLGSPSEITVTICESTRLRMTLDEIVNTEVGDLVATTTWLGNFKAAVTPYGSVDPETGERGDPKIHNYIFHFLVLFWKVLFATIPPAHIAHGWLAFAVSLCYIGVMTAIISDLASHFGCSIGLKDELTAITFVALGTSLPDMFASRLAALREETADAAIGHVNGAVAVNVFVGIGLAWSVASIVQQARGNVLYVPPGTLAFSFTTFVSFAVVVMLVVVLRRLPPVRGELGGPVVIRWLTVALFGTLWIIYVILSGLDNYCLITTF